MKHITEKKARRYLYWGIVIIGLISILGIIVFSLSSGLCHFPKTFGESLLIAVACCCSGLFLGLLFGIPKSQDKPQNASQDATQDNKNNSYVHNSDLQQISDWLTKIIVGVSLVEATTILAKVKSLLTTLANLFVNNSKDIDFYKAYCLVILVFYAVYGFIIGYLCATIYLPVLFKYADKSADDAIEAQSKEDHKARDLTEFQLTLGPGYGNITKSDLIDAISGASPDLKSEIFFKAREFRKMCEDKRTEWKNEPNKFKTEIIKTIPVFQALIEDDKKINKGEERYAFTYIQLAYVNYATEDYSGAVENFNTAFEIRERPGNKAVENYPPDYHIPEFIRAICNICINKDNKDASLMQTSNATIKADLKTVDKETLVELLSDSLIELSKYPDNKDYFEAVRSWFITVYNDPELNKQIPQLNAQNEKKNRECRKPGRE